jgi:O-antigen/teichoic acid export membrane protein
MRKSTRIIANTVASYTRLCFSAVSGFVTVPIALHTLGAADYGLFAVVAGSLSFLMFINGALTGGAQRHIAHSIGRGDSEEADRWLALSVCVHSLLGFLVLVAGWSASHIILDHILRIPPIRSAAALWVYHLVVTAMVCDVISTPYQALLMARESIAVLSVFGIGGSLLLFAGTISLRFLPGDALKWYSAIYVASQVTVLMGPMLFCISRFPACRRLPWPGVRRKRLVELLCFSGWNLFGALSGPVRMQGPALLLNHFVGPVANASYGIAMQVNGFTSNISSGLLRATSPAIVKSEAAGERRQMIQLANFSNKGAFLILWLAIAPILVNIRFVLKLWLSKPPADTGLFATLLLTATLIDQLTSGVIASVQAHGKIALYQVAMSTLTYMSVPVGYFLLARGLPAPTILYAVVASAALAGVARLCFAHRIFGLGILDWLATVFVPCVAIAGGALIAMKSVDTFFQPSLLETVALFLVNGVCVLGLAWILALTPTERARITERLAELTRRYRGYLWSTTPISIS